MAWTTPRDWTVGEIVTEAMMDTHVKDNLRYLKGLDGAVTLSDALILPDGAGYYLHIPVLTTTQRGNLTPTAGMLIYNSSTTQFNKYENGAWRADLGFNSDHGGLSGMGDDDHTQYALRTIMTADGDMIYRASGVWTKLVKGTGLQLLRMNAGATAPEWWTSAGAVISSGTYSGDSSANRAIAHGLGVTPKLVTIIGTNVDYVENRIVGTGLIYYSSAASQGVSAAVTAPDATNFYVGAAADYTISANSSASSRTYAWVALG